VAKVVGYLRRYSRWNGAPGLTQKEQKALVDCVTCEFGPSGFEVPKYLIEKANGQADGWPVLCRVIQMAIDDGELGLMVVIPTLDGVQFNLSFLELLADDRCTGAPICVRSGWRRVGIIAIDTNYRSYDKHKVWKLADGGHRLAFNQMVGRVRKRNLALAGRRNAATRGARLGSHQFTASERSKGGRATAERRRLTANIPYMKWVSDICQWRSDGLSLGQIAMRLAYKGARKPDGRKIGTQLIYRIIKRAQKAL
jgi:hypothetical protein